MKIVKPEHLDHQNSDGKCQISDLQGRKPHKMQMNKPLEFNPNEPSQKNMMTAYHFIANCILIKKTVSNMTTKYPQHSN